MSFEIWRLPWTRPAPNETFFLHMMKDFIFEGKLTSLREKEQRDVDDIVILIVKVHVDAGCRFGVGIKLN
jgi:hypothetical protein